MPKAVEGGTEAADEAAVPAADDADPATTELRMQQRRRRRRIGWLIAAGETLFLIPSTAVISTRAPLVLACVGGNTARAARTLAAMTSGYSAPWHGGLLHHTAHHAQTRLHGYTLPTPGTRTTGICATLTVQRHCGIEQAGRRWSC